MAINSEDFKDAKFDKNFMIILIVGGIIVSITYFFINNYM